MATGAGPRPHPHLHQPLLYVSRLPVQTTDNELAELLKECLPVRLGIKRDEVGQDGCVEGTIEFKEFVKAEKALSTLSSILYLSPHPPPFFPLPPSKDSLPRVVSGFGESATAGDVWESLRPVSLREIRLLQRSWTDGGEWLVEFWYEDDARSFEERPPQLSTGHLLSIVPYNPRRAPPPALIPAAPSQATALSSYYTPSHSRTPSAGFSSGPLSPLSVGAPAFVPSASGSPRAPLSGVNMWPTSPGVEMGGGAYNPGLGLGLGSPTGLGLSTFGPGQQVQPAPVQGPGSTSASGLIDPCNLFCKNLDSNLSSQDLFNAFRTFGQIVSARVMKDEMGVSRGFGFVSYHNPQDAHIAMTTMDGHIIGDKAMTVRLHEPKRFRAEKLAEQRAARSAMSPSSRYGDLPEGGHADTYAGHGRTRSSGYLATPPQSSPRAPDVDDLATVTPERRRGILTAEVHKRVVGLPSVAKDEVDAVVKTLVGLDLGIVGALKDDHVLEEKVNTALALLHVDEHRPSTTDATGLLCTSTPSEMSRTSSPANERDRLSTSISRLEANEVLASEILDMILSLKKKDRALCLFNNDFLKEKVDEAREVLAMQGDDSSEDRHRLSRSPNDGQLHPRSIATPQRAHSAPIEPGTPLSPKTAAQKGSGLVPASTPTSPAGSSIRGSDMSDLGLRSDLPPLETVLDLDSELAATSYKSLTEVAEMSAKEAIAYLRENASVMEDREGLAVDEDKSKEMTTFLSSLDGKQSSQQKQSLGERLFKAIRAWDPPRSVKAPKITISLLDSEDLHSLGYLLSDYPLVLREKVALAAGLSSWPTAAA